ncbi:MAG: hypothetical protein JWL63_2520 [Rhodocyclales bacterium]|nr:hypothetical protein [Rhodocyclales bacterium]
MNIQANKYLRGLYCLALILTFFPTALFGSTGWAALATGGGLLAGGALLALPMLFAFIYRIFLVAKYKDTLNAINVNGFTALVRKLGILLMILGVLGAVSILFTRVIALGIFGQAGEGGIAYFVVGMYAYLIAGLGLPGVMVFEASRLFGFEQPLRS